MTSLPQNRIEAVDIIARNVCISTLVCVKKLIEQCGCRGVVGSENVSMIEEVPAYFMTSLVSQCNSV